MLIRSPDKSKSRASLHPSGGWLFYTRGRVGRLKFFVNASLLVMGILLLVLPAMFNIIGGVENGPPSQAILVAVLLLLLSVAYVVMLLVSGWFFYTRRQIGWAGFLVKAGWLSVAITAFLVIGSMGFAATEDVSLSWVIFEVYDVLFIISAYAVVLMLLFLIAKRLNDVNISGLFVLPLVLGGVLIFLVGPILCLIPGNRGPNRYGPPPLPNSKALKVTALVMTLVLIAVASFFMHQAGLLIDKRQSPAMTAAPSDDKTPEAAP